MKCFCSPSRPDCPPSRQKECDPSVSHCLLSLLWNEDTKSFVESIQDCWMWSDKSKCPDEAGPCHVLQESVGKFMACCCKGPLCNNATDLRFVSISGSEPQSGLLTNLTDDSSAPLPDNVSVSHSFKSESLAFIAVPSVLLFCLAVLLFVTLYCCHRRGRTFKLKSHFKMSRPKHHCECQLVKLKSPGFLPSCTCEHFNKHPEDVGEKSDPFFGSRKVPSVGAGWLAPDEIEGLASIVRKLELKSQGCFGQVWHARLPSTSLNNHETQDTDADVAVKIFRAAQQDSWSTELCLFRVPGLRHPNILKFIGADQILNDCLDPPEMEYWLITEYHHLGSLHDYLKFHTISWNELVNIAWGIARGLSHLHSEVTSVSGTTLLIGQMKPSIAHRDLNSRNVLLKNDLSACIADFGLAIRFEPGHFPSDAHPQLGTRRYMAPEVLDGAIQFSRDAYLRIDVYAMGLVFWELMTRCYGTEGDPIEITNPYRAPFEAELGPAPTIEELQRFVAHEKRRPKFDPNWSQYPSMCSLWETTEECWDQDAEARLSAGCVAERLATLSTQSWSGSQSHGPLKLPPITSPAPLPGSTPRPTQASTAVRTSHRIGPNSLVSFPVPSVSFPFSDNIQNSTNQHHS